MIARIVAVVFGCILTAGCLIAGPVNVRQIAADKFEISVERTPLSSSPANDIAPAHRGRELCPKGYREIEKVEDTGGEHRITRLTIQCL
jgi:hypothetical protein